MTHKLFWDDPYRQTLDTRVTRVAGPEVMVGETILYAFSGGQESDHGTIGGRPVLGARKDGLTILYDLGPDHGLSPGDPVGLVLDWSRRYRLMRLHFAAEIILELVMRDFGPLEKTGAHIAPDKARIDFTWEGSIAPIFPSLLESSGAVIARDLPIITAFSDEASQRRYWEIEGFARVPCGGTHPRRTGEIGPLALKRKNIGKGRERIEVLLAGD
ncbi:alanyl-tRNA editing protein [Rhodospirillum rubrum]|uniref:Alanyl-tRNA synthetase related protein n=1 Tax=Rhodospirillum rubrum (strain ATCC 11170 / ATH 1.1.1 / DSM 467 / LMG 4362 / NCIMB 8255 / S1) TaxID=269796 RepID=Q2RQ31_RHORT|nr:alanyl-tRNA editing protein [Rhodospirillum rubrum]ABC23764.1 alanyl-tRNA synthetase related protein [Rhodospirillum rubrum ATCC 11170]AEO49504.1 alanyl-tRNA synthetase related protein [Rhodospirillum rubrum F11]MBK5955445.1 alanyl-tRNA editing protein [Rhodospirillum rubrum]QXG79716.1 alanyl-tRNA editing protein [Rhodospirillum rubrum]